MTSKAFWALRAAGKYGEARQFLAARILAGAPIDPEALWELGHVLLEGALGFEQNTPMADSYWRLAAANGHQAAAVTVAGAPMFCEMHDVPQMPPLETLTCPLARAYWYSYRGRAVEATDPIEDARCSEMEYMYYKQAAIAGIVPAMEFCGIEWLIRGVAYGHPGCLHTYTMQATVPERFFDCIKKAALQGILDAGLHIIEAFTQNWHPSFPDGANRTWIVPWRLGAQVILRCPDPVMQCEILLQRLRRDGPFGAPCPQYRQEMYYYSVSPVWHCTCPSEDKKEQPPCRCYMDDLHLKPLEGRRPLAGRNKELTAGLECIRRSIVVPSSRAIRTLYGLTRLRYGFPRDLASLLAGLVRDSRMEEADVWADVADK
jgi:hypothetical protein